MNIQGIFLLKEKGLPVMENIFIFRDVSEIPESHLDKYKNKKLWAMRGFDDRTKLTDSPYKIKDFRIHGFSKDEVSKRFHQIDSDMEKAGIPKYNRIFLICRVYYDQDVEFSGHTLKREDTIFIDILECNRPSGRDWNPDISFKIKLINNRPIFSNISESPYRDRIIKVCMDIMKFHRDVYIDFTLFKEGYFFYHDLSLH